LMGMSVEVFIIRNYQVHSVISCFFFWCKLRIWNSGHIAQKTHLVPMATRLWCTHTMASVYCEISLVQYKVI
jgi:hypothetical protein